MPQKQPDVWAAIWEWLQVGGGMHSIQSMGSAVIVTILRYGFMRKKPAFRYVIIDAMICASLSGVIVPILADFFNHPEFSGFVGGFLGFLGTEKIRELLISLIHKKIEVNDINLGGKSDDSYNDSDEFRR
ncbi:phage holin, lambda family [Basfia succiniciproducens]|uniref:phage holin, lambda family n=1 Tax=Basfia succiniciproducens TaxID=653940 RepID=UPI0008B4E96D|nr:phage holin, lambda family [Basfia succiniciproducens]SEQ76685.1 phage holin, lambda family [Basfia succiniciproducens]